MPEGQAEPREGPRYVFKGHGHLDGAPRALHSFRQGACPRGQGAVRESFGALAECPPGLGEPPPWQRAEDAAQVLPWASLLTSWVSFQILFTMARRPRSSRAWHFVLSAARRDADARAVALAGTANWGYDSDGQVGPSGGAWLQGSRGASGGNERCSSEQRRGQVNPRGLQ